MFAGNTAWEGAGARFCFFFGVIAEPSVSWNTFLDNEAGNLGGGMGIYSADPVVANCTFDGNSAGSLGGGVYAAACEEAPSLLNTIVANSTSGGGVALVDAVLTTAYCDVWGNTDGDYVGCAPSPTDFSADPLYCDPVNRDLTLRDDSPCLPENNMWEVLVGAHPAGGCGTSAGWEHAGDPSFRLDSPFPNPARGPVTLSYELASSAGAVELTILTVGGRVVRRLPAAPGSAGRHEVVWDARGENGRPVASGAYLVRGCAAGRTSYRGVVVLNRS